MERYKTFEELKKGDSYYYFEYHRRLDGELVFCLQEIPILSIEITSIPCDSKEKKSNAILCTRYNKRYNLNVVDIFNEGLSSSNHFYADKREIFDIIISSNDFSESEIGEITKKYFFEKTSR